MIRIEYCRRATSRRSSRAPRGPAGWTAPIPAWTTSVSASSSTTRARSSSPDPAKQSAWSTSSTKVSPQHILKNLKDFFKNSIDFVGLRRAAEKISEREELKRQDGRELLTPEEVAQARESIAYGCVKYADLSHNHNLDYVFSFDKVRLSTVTNLIDLADLIDL